MSKAVSFKNRFFAITLPIGLSHITRQATLWQLFHNFNSLNNDILKIDAKEAGEMAHFSAQPNM